jgi:soluble lytic murein transglycosylase
MRRAWTGTSFERIPFAETRNYVQRVMENLQVYRVRFGESTAVTFEPDLGANTADERARTPVCKPITP